jgi:hypothetical protein
VLAQTVEQTPRFIVTLDASLSPEASLVRVPLAITGKWARGASQFAITRQDLEDIVGNFGERLNGEINVDYDHASEMPEVAAGGPIPSAGRIVKLDRPEPVGPGLAPARPTQGSALQDGRFILYGWYEPTPRARQLIQNREYRFISPAIDWAARHKRTGKPQGATLTSVALTNRPFLEEMPPIRLSDPDYQPVDDITPPSGQKPAGQTPALHAGKTPARQQGGPMKQVTLSVVDGKIKIAHPDLNDAFFASPEDVKKCLDELGLPQPAEASASAGASPALASELEKLAGRPGASPAECLAEITQRLAGRQEISLAQASALLSEADSHGMCVSALEFFRAQVDRELEEAVRSGKVLPRQREDWRKIALSDFPAFRRILAGQKPQVPLRPTGLSGSAPEDVQTQVKLLVEQRCRERHVSFGQALSEIGREQPELVHQYRRAVSGA